MTQRTTPEPQIIIAPLQLLEEEGGHAFQRALDNANDYLDDVTFAGAAGQEAPPLVHTWLERNADELRKLGRKRRGMIYLHYRLEEPPATIGDAMRELLREKLHFIAGQVGVAESQASSETRIPPGATTPR